jgi:hypothetical protein
MEGLVMAKPKILDLTIDELIKIAKALNENTLANKKRSLDEKINNDKFISQMFNVSRKDFSHTIKNIKTGIEYNPKTFLYDIPEQHKEVTEVLPIKPIEKTNGNHSKAGSNTKVTLAVKTIDEMPITKVLPMELFEIADMTKELKEMISWHKGFTKDESAIKELLEWYKQTKPNENIIEIPQINLDKNKLRGEIKTRSFKIYQQVLEDFKKYCERHGEFKQQDLLSMALIEYMDKYK